VAGVLANVATGHVVNTSKLRQQEQLSEHLPEAQASRAIIEQAREITANRHSATVEQAYQLMRWHARNNNATLRVAAEAIVAGKLQV
jgi:AmiR/NasT family two-component response regulator